jgi:prepilin peptidase CpaA
VGLFIGFALFALGWIGGGDAKLFAAVCLWLGFHDLAPYALLASVFGGVLTLGLVLLRQWPLPGALARQGWIVKLHDARSGIPYGVALACGAFALLPSTEIFRLAATV